MKTGRLPILFSRTRILAAAKYAGAGILIGLALFFAFAILYSSFCAFTNWKFGTSGDYIRYTNMIWNTGRGNWFQYAVGTQSYLWVHLSFTLGLLGPLFYIWDHPFLLAAVQWIAIATGAALLVLAGRKQKISPHLLGALAVFWFGYPFTQSVQLCEFHSTAGYMLFLPWIYYALIRNRRTVWIPLVLLCGLREEAGLYAVPLLLLFAVRDRWHLGYLWAGACIAYATFATFWLFPALHPNNQDIFEARQEIFRGQWHDYLENWKPRAFAIFWALLPSLSALGRPIHPFVALIPLPMIANLASHWPWQYALKIHYPANVMASVAIALADAWAQGRSTAKTHAGWIRALALIAITLVAHYARGFTFGSKPVPFNPYTSINPDGLDALRIAQRFLPKEGVLTAHRELLSMAANRRDAVYMNLVTPSQTPFDLNVVFARTRHLPEEYKQLVRSGAWGVRYADGRFCILQPGIPTALNARLLERWERPVFFLGNSRKQHGKTVFEEGRGAVRYWRGRTGARRKPIALGSELDVQPGRYLVTVEFRNGQLPRKDAYIGEFILNDTRADRHVLAAPIRPGPPGVWQTQSFEYRVPAPTRLELQVMGGETDLWLDRAFVDVIPDSPSASPGCETQADGNVLDNVTGSAPGE